MAYLLIGAIALHLIFLTIKTRQNMSQIELLQTQVQRINVALGNINTQNAQQKEQISSLQAQIEELKNNAVITEEQAAALLTSLQGIAGAAEAISDVVEGQEPSEPAEPGEEA